MFAALYAAFKVEMALFHMGNISSALHDLIENFEEDYFKDKNARNAAIDAICQFLQERKNGEKK